MRQKKILEDKRVDGRKESGPKIKKLQRPNYSSEKRMFNPLGAKIKRVFIQLLKHVKKFSLNALLQKHISLHLFYTLVRWDLELENISVT